MGAGVRCRLDARYDFEGLQNFHGGSCGVQLEVWPLIDGMFPVSSPNLSTKAVKRHLKEM